MPSPRTWLLNVIVFLLLMGQAPAQAQQPDSVPALLESATVYVAVEPLALALGVVATTNANSLTWRGQQGVVTFFEASPEALLQAANGGEPLEWSLSAPVRIVNQAWFVPLDAVQLLGLLLPDDLGAAPTALTLPGGREMRLDYGAVVPQGADSAAETAEGGATLGELGVLDPGWELADVAPALPALRFFTDDGVSLMLVDLVLVPLAFPELTRLVDEAADEAAAASGDQPLLLLVTALHATSWDARLRFVQGERTLEVDDPFRLLLRLGSSETVSPTEPAAGVVLLPPSFNLYRPLRVEWGDLSAEVTFRN